MNNRDSPTTENFTEILLSFPLPKEGFDQLSRNCVTFRRFCHKNKPIGTKKSAEVVGGGGMEKARDVRRSIIIQYFAKTLHKISFFVRSQKLKVDRCSTLDERGRELVEARQAHVNIGGRQTHIKLGTICSA